MFARPLLVHGFRETRALVYARLRYRKALGFL